MINILKQIFNKKFTFIAFKYLKKQYFIHLLTKQLLKVILVKQKGKYLMIYVILENFIQMVILVQHHMIWKMFSLNLTKF